MSVLLFSFISAGAGRHYDSESEFDFVMTSWIIHRSDLSDFCKQASGLYPTPLTLLPPFAPALLASRSRCSLCVYIQPNSSSQYGAAER